MILDTIIQDCHQRNEGILSAEEMILFMIRFFCDNPQAGDDEFAEALLHAEKMRIYCLLHELVHDGYLISRFKPDGEIEYERIFGQTPHSEEVRHDR